MRAFLTSYGPLVLLVGLTIFVVVQAEECRLRPRGIPPLAAAVLGTAFLCAGLPVAAIPWYAVTLVLTAWAKGWV